MKYFLIALFIVPILSFSSINNNQRFVGKWIGEDKGDVGMIIFDKEGYAYFEIGEKSFGGKEFIYDGKKGKLTYSINSELDPIQVDFTITKLKTNEQMNLLGIAKFIDNENMILALNFDDSRPNEFNDDNSIHLKKVE
tara:strand:+ start:64 stop:477 length:414 start_codon:yes stop_codon:yes gene_type:complete